LTLIERGAGGIKNKTTTTHPQSLRQEDDERGGGARGRPRRNANATCQRVGHQATRPTPPVDAQAINVDSSSATATTEHNSGARGMTSAGGGEGLPTPQRRCHLSRGPSSNAADTTRRRAGHQHGLLLSNSTTERNCGARGDDERGVG
jgi:hypothetical protein